MSYEKINSAMMEILEDKYKIKINSRVEVKTNEKENVRNNANNVI